MTQAQFKRANAVGFPILLIIIGYVLFSLIAFVLVSPDQVTWKSYVQLFSAIVALLITLLSFLLKRQTAVCSYGMIYSATAMYFMIRLFGTTEDSGMYAFTIIMSAVIFMNMKMIYIVNAAVLSANLIRLILRFEYINTDDGSTMVVTIFVCILMAIASIRIVNLLVKFNKDNLDTALEASKNQLQNHDLMVSVAENIIQHFEEATVMLDTLQQSINSSHESMKNIADSTDDTALAIQSEAEVCSEIRNQTDCAEELTRSMSETSTTVKSSILDGSDSIRELRLQAQKVSASSKVVEDVIQELTSKVHEVEAFIDTIMTISGQTNLLALNASIEAARAGEAGKGFAVVADEIRKLSDDTKTASSKITSIIQALNADTIRANESIEVAMESVSFQNDLITTTEDAFQQVDNEVAELMKNIASTKAIIDQIVESSNTIYDNISQLSATSEEVAASMNEGLQNSNVTVDETKRCKTIFESIYQLALELKSN